MNNMPTVMVDALAIRSAIPVASRQLPMALANVNRPGPRPEDEVLTVHA